jgi:succinate dehydrogenase/fumarate reductase flavoprotein subunit
MLTLLLLTACSSPSGNTDSGPHLDASGGGGANMTLVDADGGSDGGSDGGGDTGDGGGDTGDGGDGGVPQVADVDVVVVGGGAAGCGAAWMLWDAGVDFILVEQNDFIGGGGTWAARMFAAGTELQASRLVTDSPEFALSEWASITSVEASSPITENFLFASASVLDWIAGYGGAFTSVATDPDTGSVSRIHEGSEPELVSAELAATIGDDLWLSTKVTDLVVEDGTVVGVEVADQKTGELGMIRAKRVIMATGGWSRNESWLLEAMPGLAETGWVAESLAYTDGNGTQLMADIGAPLQNMDGAGVYGHSFADVRYDPPRALVPVGLNAGLIVNSDGERVMDEDDIRAFGSGRNMNTMGTLYMIADDSLWNTISLIVMPFDYDVETFKDMPEATMTIDAFDALGTSSVADTAEELAKTMGMDPEVLTATIDRFNEFANSGVDADFGRTFLPGEAVDTSPFHAVALAAGPAKSFGGVGLSTTGQVLGADGEPIPGLYAGGEVAGMLGNEDMGWGFSGGITACWYSGLLAGEAVAEDLAIERGHARLTAPRWRPVVR